MQDASIIKAIEGKDIELLDDLDERGRRRWAAVEARSLGRGGITTVALATGLSDRTIRTGLKELNDPAPLASHRQRRSGGGRQAHEIHQPGLQDALDRLIEPTVRGSSMWGNPKQFQSFCHQRVSCISEYFKTVSAARRDSTFRNDRTGRHAIRLRVIVLREMLIT